MMQLPKGRHAVIPLMGAPGAALTRTTLRQNLTDAETQHQSLMALFDKFHPDGLFLFMDLTVEAECLGLPLVFPDNENPSVAEHPVKDLQGLEMIRKRWKGIGGRMPVFLKTMEQLAKSKGWIKGSYVIGPLTLAGELVGVSNLAIASIENEELVAKTVDFSFEVVSTYARALIDAGSDVIAVLEPTAVIFSPVQFRKLCAEYFMRLQKALNTRLILHVCGDTTHQLQEMFVTNALGLRLDTMVDFGKAITRIPSDMMLIGNVSPVDVFLNGKPGQVEAEVRNLLTTIGDRLNFILSSGCDLPMDVPIDNIVAFMNAGRQVRLETSS
jgi:uroporphyrinogen decarboxylase